MLSEATDASWVRDTIWGLYLSVMVNIAVFRGECVFSVILLFILMINLTPTVNLKISMPIRQFAKIRLNFIFTTNCR